MCHFFWHNVSHSCPSTFVETIPVSCDSITYSTFFLYITNTHNYTTDVSINVIYLSSDGQSYDIVSIYHMKERSSWRILGSVVHLSCNNQSYDESEFVTTNKVITEQYHLTSFTCLVMINVIIDWEYTIANKEIADMHQLAWFIFRLMIDVLMV